MIVEYVIQCPMPLPLHILQFLLSHAEIVTEFIYQSLANLMTNFCLMGVDRLNVLDNALIRAGPADKSKTLFLVAGTQ